MAIYEAPRAPSTAGKAGEAFAGGIGKALEAITHHKMQQLHKRQYQGQVGEALKALKLSPELASLPESALNTILKGAFDQQRYAQAARQKAQEEGNPQDLLRLISGEYGQEEPSQVNQQQNLMQQEQQIPQQRLPLTQQQLLNQAFQGHALDPELAQQELDQEKLKQKPITQKTKGPELVKPSQNKKPTASQLAKLTPKQLDQYLKYERDQQKINASEVNAAKQQKHELEKAERPYYQTVVDQYQTSHAELGDLKRLEHLINQGKVVNPTEDHMQRWLSGALKINLKDLRGADTEEYEKIVAGFIKNAKKIFGARVTNFDLKAFMKTLPELSTSHEGKMRLISSMKAAVEAQQLRYKELKKLMKENDGHIPPYAQMKVEERIKPQIDKYLQQFISGNSVTPLSKEALAGSQRGWWMRPAKAGITGAFNAAPSFGGIVNALKNGLL